MGQPHLAPPLPSVPQPLLLRKGSFAALTSSSLATIPDDTESYALDTLNESALASPDTPSPSSAAMPPLASSRFGSSLGPGSSLPAGPDVVVGDAVDVPGGMTGDVRFVGSVAGRKGVFAGIELHREFASRGKNNGDVDGVAYFRTRMPGAGIFVPLSKAMRRDTSATLSPLTPTGHGLKAGNQNSVNFTPPTPSLPKFNQPASGRSSSPMGKRSTRISLSRPESPARRLQTTPVPRPSLVTPGPRQSVGGSSRYGSPTNKFSQSVRGGAPPTLGDPSKRGLSLRPDRASSIGPRSVSALGGTVSNYDDDAGSVGLNRPRTNVGGAIGGGFGPHHGQGARPPSRAMSPVKNGSSEASAADEEVERLRAELEDRDQQLKEQASTLADMESSLTELQTLIESPDGPMGNGGNRRDSMDDKDSAQLRALLREKNDKIAMLTAEFDSHRADFRITIDTLEVASSETERVYEKKIEDLMQEINELEKNSGDFNAITEQLKQLEELVQELEDGLEDSRRGEADARGEVEYLRGELERTKSEMQRERECQKVKPNGGGDFGNNTNWSDTARLQQAEIDRKDDEIRGLKAIIHSLSQDSETNGNKNGGRDGPSAENQRGESASERMAREKLEREVSDLKALVNSKSARETELEHELEQLRQAAARPSTAPSGGSAGSMHGHQRGSLLTNGSRSSLRDSRGTVVLSQEFRETVGATGAANNSNDTRSPDLSRRMHHARGPTLDTMPESDAYSSVTDSSTLWCEICETNGHDILTCTNMFGSQSQPPKAAASPMSTDAVPTTGLGISDMDDEHDVKNSDDDGIDGAHDVHGMDNVDQYVAPLEPARAKTPTAPAEVKIMPNLMDSGPVAGKESGSVDLEKWCALCERDGHDSVDCPFEDAF